MLLGKFKFMLSRRVKSIVNLFIGCAAFTVIIAGLAVFCYLKVLPWTVSNPKVISYVEDVLKKSCDIDVDIINPVLKTKLSLDIGFTVDNILLKHEKDRLVDVEKLDTEFSLAEIFNKNVVIKHVNLDYIFADVNKLLDLPILKSDKEKPKTETDWNIDILRSVLAINKADIIYNIDKDTLVKLSAFGLRIDDNTDKKHINYNLRADISKGKNNLLIKTSDEGKVYIENIESAVIDNTKVYINNSTVFLKAHVDNKSNYRAKVTGKAFEIPAVIDLLNTRIIENNLSEQLAYFKDIGGNFDFEVNLDNKSMKGNLNLNNLSFKLVPFSNLPVLLTQGFVDFDEKNIKLKDFKGYYNGKSSNSMDFEGTVDDYIKSVDTNLEGNAIVTDDFARNYLSKMAGYPIGIVGRAETKVKLHSIYNKIDLKWLYWFKKGSGFIIDGQESFMNDAASRVLSAKIHFEDMMLNIESLNYYAGNPEGDMEKIKIPIVSAYGDIDLSNGETFVKKFGMELPKPMPSGFINVLAKQKIFKGGTFTGHFDLVNKRGHSPKVKADLKAENVAIPSQRLFIKSGEFKTDRENMHIKANGRYRRSAYDLSGTIVNEVKLPIVVKNITFNIDKISVEKYLKLFNQQQSTVASTDINAAIADSIAKNGDADVDDDDDVSTFDLANLIIEECILHVDKGFYKDINFADVTANLTLDKDSMLKITSNKFEIAEGHSSAKIDCDLKNHKYAVRLGIKEVNSDIIATSLLNLKKEIAGKASGLIELNTDDSLKLNGRIQFRVYKGVIGKVGLVEYIMKVASLFRNPLTMISPSVVSDLVNIPEGQFDQIDGDLILKNNVVVPMKIKSSASQLSSYIVGTYDLEKQDAALRIYTKFSNRRKGLYGVFRNISLNSLANRIQLGSRNDSDYYSAEISQLPEIDADEKDCQIFLTKVDGDVEHNNFISSLKKIK